MSGGLVEVALDGAAVGLPAAVLAGAAGAVALSVLDLRGTVAAVPACLGLAVAPLHSAALWAVAAAVLAGATREYWRSDDLGKGQDKARRAREARGIAQIARNARDRRRLARGSHDARDRYPIGVDGSGAVVWLPVGIDQGRHSLLIGATGSGKTTTMLASATAYLRAGAGVIAVDAKGSRELAGYLREAASAAGREFRHFTLDGRDSDRWNPLAHGTASERADKLIAAEEWTEPHYKRLYQRYLLTAFTAIQARGLTPDLAMVVDLLHPPQLAVFAREVPAGPVAEQIDNYLAELTDQERRDLAGLRNRLAILAESEHGHLFTPSGDGRQIDLVEVIRERAVVVFSINTSRYPEIGKLLGAAIFQDLQSVAGIVEADRSPARPSAVLIDEFGAFGADHAVGLFQRARSVCLSLTLATQELADLRRIDAAFQDQILGNVEVVIAHRQNVPASAELVAELAGTRNVWVRTFQSDRSPTNGPTTRGSMHRGHEFRVAPDTIKALDVGQAVVITKNPHAVHITQIQPARKR